MPSRRFDQTKPFITLGVLLLVWLIFPTVLKRFARDGFYEMQSPVEVSASYLRELQDYWALRTRSKNDIIAAYRDLGGVVAKYAHSAEENVELRREVARLERLLRLPSFDNYRSEPARVVSRDFNGWWQRLTIRKGANFNLPVGAPVIFAGGVVGRITEVHSTTAIVDLISSPNVRLAASFENDDRPMSFQGGLNPPLSRPQATVEFVPLDLQANPANPQPLVTSGLGGVFPRGLRLGTVIQLEPSLDGLFKTGRVNLDPRLNQVTEVTVLVPLDPL
ncbi:rod shape-determining protein MreC [Synoicihabitans lomoniglobus]|uniref:Cell shape-determining protein MreC n=1 Tax=Synoicihabitans lomoniglobus TaxID=2909285 RepID=A0AAE9ZYG2_9BACT|nr:rod shape-determining protein MreC [Opitutaceae bacterium LMO-M01]WED63508.1 rod shape-determining protein MreC [Opitutaceae bacterium LMO-M01]